MSRVVIALVITAALAVSACARTTPDTGSAPLSQERPAAPPAAGTSLPVGLHELGDGSVVAVGILRRVELEGGFWAITEPGPDDGAGTKRIIVISNGDELKTELSALEGSLVQATGKRLEGASVRMAGPEMEAETIEAVDQGAPAER